MLSVALPIIDWFVPEQSRLSKSDLGRARTFVFTHLVGPATTGASIVAFLAVVDPSPGLSIVVIAGGIASFWLLLPVLRVSGNLPLVAIVSVQTLIAVILYGVYNYGGVSSPFLAWLLIALANGFFYLSDRPLTVLAIFVLNVAAFIAIWWASGDLPHRVPMEQMSNVGIVSVTGATLYMAWLAIYYARLLTSEIRPRARSPAAPPDDGTTRRGEGQGRTGEPREVYLSRQNEPRIADAAQRRHWLQQFCRRTRTFPAMLGVPTISVENCRGRQASACARHRRPRYHPD